tara:strand:+ start:184 stop:507 length:324 start_codon:yes stop_codon:yes gene_type:complete
MEKYLFLNTGTNDSICLPVSRLVDMGVGASDGTVLDLHFTSPFGGNDGVGEITKTLAITDNKGKVVMEAIADEIRHGKEPFITVVDDTTGEKLHTNITSVGAITDFS